MSPVHLVLNWPVFTIYICCFIFYLPKHNFKCSKLACSKRVSNFENGHVGIADMAIFHFLKITAVRHLGFSDSQNFNSRWH